MVSGCGTAANRSFSTEKRRHGLRTRVLQTWQVKAHVRMTGVMQTAIIAIYSVSSDLCCMLSCCRIHCLQELSCPQCKYAKQSLVRKGLPELLVHACVGISADREGFGCYWSERRSACLDNFGQISNCTSASCHVCNRVCTDCFIELVPETLHQSCVPPG